MSENLLSLRKLGRLAKITHVDDDGEIHFRMQDGRTGHASVYDDANPEIGDVVLLDDNSWEFAPAGLWRDTTSVSVVLRVLDGGAAIVEVGSMTRTIHNPEHLELEVGNTIEYSDDDGVLQVLSDTPVRSGGFEIDVEQVRAQYLVKGSEKEPSFSDFGGYPHVKARALELIETQLDRREQLEKIRAKPVKGIIFTGPPGTGKTHLARIIAHEADADFFLVSGPSIVSKYVGDTEDTLRKIFATAASSTSGKAIVFFDEIDSIAERRSNDSHEASKRLVAQLLTEMDGFDQDPKAASVIVIAATNRIEVLDPALTRPGRFDWEIAFGMPTAQDRFEILKVRSSHLATTGDLPLEDLAALTEGWSAADLTSIWTEAALVAAGDEREFIAAEDLAQAFERVVGRPRRHHVEEAAQ